MFGAIDSLQRLGDDGSVTLDTPILQGCQFEWLSFTSQNSADNSQPRHSADVTDHVLQLQIHLCQRLLHLLHRTGGAANQLLALPHVAAQHANLRVWSKRSSQQTEALQLLQPLTILHIALAPGYVLY